MEGFSVIGWAPGVSHCLVQAHDVGTQYVASVLWTWAGGGERRDGGLLAGPQNSGFQGPPLPLPSSLPWCPWYQAVGRSHGSPSDERGHWAILPGTHLQAPCPQGLTVELVVLLIRSQGGRCS